MTLVLRPGRRVATSLLSAGLAILLVASSAFASTPVTVGYRDHTYGFGASRPTSDKPQSKLWYTDGSWFAGMFLYQTSPTAKSENRIWRLNGSTHAWSLTSTVIDTRDESHADYYWDETAQTLWVASVNPPNRTNPIAAASDGIRIYKYTYSAATNVYTAAAGFPKTIQNTTTVANTFAGGAWTVTINREAASGRLWTAWPKADKVLYSYSDDGGATWTDPAQVPVQVGNSINSVGVLSHDDTASVITFGTKIGVAWSDQDNLPAATDNGYYFAVIDAGADPTVGGNWTLQKLPTLTTPGQTADNHINLKTTSDGSVYMVGKTGKDTAGCATNQNAVLVEFFDRTPGGTWSAHLVGTVGDCNTRPQVVISEQLDTAYVFLTSPNGGGTVYVKSAPLSGSEAFKFRGTADTTIQRGTPFIQSATETLIDDPSTTKQVVTSASGIVVIANNLTKAGTSNAKYFLHNEMALPASDAAAPSGTISINAGALGTTTASVTVAVPATDSGSGVSLVRLSNSGTTSGGVLTSGTTYVYPAGAANIAWTLSAGDGTKTVYAQWRDAAGNWSAPVNDTIILDATAPTGTVVINNDDAETTTAAVTLTLTTDDGTGTGTTQVLISNSSDFTGVTPIAYETSIPWTLTGGNGSKTVYVKFIDGAGNVSASPVSDSITLNSPDTTNPNPPSSAPKQVIAGTETFGIPIRLIWGAGSDPNTDPSSGVAGYDIQESVNGGAFATIAHTTGPGTTLDRTLSNTSKTYRYRVATRDNSGNLSTFVAGPTFKAISYNEVSSVISYSGTWYLAEAISYIGHHAKYATAAGASATATISGNRVGWLGRKGPTSGTAKVYVDGVLKATINMYAATTQIRQLLFTYSWTTIGTHKLKIVVSGTAGHPRVTLDQILVLR
jgi:hypothetical protein